jgi:uncharacterized protein (DUF305 family)
MENNMPKLRSVFAVSIALATVITLAACSSNTGSGSMKGTDMGGSSSSVSPKPNSGPHNDADVAFATGMVPHHKQAVEMADMILKKDGINNDVLTLARKIKAAQDPEIIIMTSWLTSWGSSPMGSASSMPGMDMGTGMMSDADMASLSKSTGAAASKLFLQQMTQHHTGAIGMATTEIASGKNPEAIALAKSIVKDQTTEISTMQKILATL